MKLEHFGMAEPGDCRVVFTASAQELEEAIAAEQAGENPPADEEDLMAAAVNRAILTGFSPLYAELVENHKLLPVTDPDFELLAVNRDSGPGRSSSVCRRWSWAGTPALCSPSSPGLCGS